MKHFRLYSLHYSISNERASIQNFDPNQLTLPGFKPSINQPYLLS